jgi:Plasmid stabilisation system protein.
VRLIVSKEALADLSRLRDFLADKDIGTAQRAVATLNNAIRSLEVFPGRGRPSGVPGLRELVGPFGNSAYLLRYTHQPEADRLIIVRVWHAREGRESPRRR